MKISELNSPGAVAAIRVNETKPALAYCATLLASALLKASAARGEFDAAAKSDVIGASRAPTLHRLKLRPARA
jgi:hypothetical protein